MVTKGLSTFLNRILLLTKVTIMLNTEINSFITLIMAKLMRVEIVFKFK